MLFAAPRIFLYIPASKRSISYLFHNPAAAIGVPIQISSDLARQQVSCCSTSGSIPLSFHLRREVFLWIWSLDIFSYSFLSIATLTPRYLTLSEHFTPPTSLISSPVSISDFFLFSLRFHFTQREESSFIIISTSPCELDITSISSANASRSPLFLTSSNFLEELIASSKYTLNKTGDSTDPCGSHISALICYSPTWIVDYLCNLVINSTSASSLSFLHLFLSSYHSISLSTESQAFYKSMSRLNFLFLLPCTSLRSLAAWIAVDFPSLKPVQYIFDSIR